MLTELPPALEDHIPDKMARGAVSAPDGIEILGKLR
jgi:hypothetical protein